MGSSPLPHSTSTLHASFFHHHRNKQTRPQRMGNGIPSLLDSAIPRLTITTIVLPFPCSTIPLVLVQRRPTLSDLYCAVCSEPWDAYGVHHGDMMAWEARLFKAGAGCPCCKGQDPVDSTDSDRDARQLQAAESASNSWDDPDSFPLVLDLFASAVGAPMPKRKPWVEPKPRVLWTCTTCKVQCVEALAYSLCEPNAPDQQLDWHGGERVHYRYGRAYSYGDLRDADDPDREAPYSLEGKDYCPGCAQVCDGHNCASIILKNAEGDSYESGASFTDPDDAYGRDSYCLTCFETLTSERELEEEETRRRDLARDIWRWKDSGYSNADVRARILRERR